MYEVFIFISLCYYLPCYHTVLFCFIRLCGMKSVDFVPFSYENWFQEKIKIQHSGHECYRSLFHSSSSSPPVACSNNHITALYAPCVLFFHIIIAWNAFQLCHAVFTVNLLCHSTFQMNSRNISTQKLLLLLLFVRARPIDVVFFWW